jgi:sulfur transfer protein SufE
MTKKEKITNLLRLKQAKDKGEEVFELGRRLDELKEKLENIKQPETKDEEIEVTLSIE